MKYKYIIILFIGLAGSSIKSEAQARVKDPQTVAQQRQMKVEYLHRKAELDRTYRADVAALNRQHLSAADKTAQRAAIEEKYEQAVKAANLAYQKERGAFEIKDDARKDIDEKKHKPKKH